jgi:anti-sigma factor RsiW
MTDDMSRDAGLDEEDRWLLDAGLDGELDAARSLELTRRLEAEPVLRERWEARRALREAVRTGARYHRAPDALRTRLQEAMAVAEGHGAADPGAATAAGTHTRPGISRGEVPARVRHADVPPRADEAAHVAQTPSAGFVSPATPRSSRVPRDRASMAPWSWLGLGGLGGAFAAVLVMMVILPNASRQGPGAAAPQAVADDAFDGEAVSAHTRALLVGQTLEVASSDRHTVRPWLASRMNFVPPVVDFADRGFPLAGARRDVIGGETAAALVYRRGSHVVSVFVRPEAGTAQGPRLEVVRGFNVVTLRTGGMAYTLVSDMSGEEMGELAKLLQSAA